MVSSTLPWPARRSLHGHRSRLAEMARSHVRVGWSQLRMGPRGRQTPLRRSGIVHELDPNEPVNPVWPADTKASHRVVSAAGLLTCTRPCRSPWGTHVRGLVGAVHLGVGLPVYLTSSPPDPRLSVRPVGLARPVPIVPRARGAIFLRQIGCWDGLGDRLRRHRTGGPRDADLLRGVACS